MGKIILSYNIINLRGDVLEGIHPKASELHMTSYLNELK